MKYPEKVTKYVEKNCANYTGEGLCVFGNLCPLVFDIGKKCTYAEASVIPGDAEIESLYYSARGTTKKTKSTSLCSECNKPFVKKSNAQKYCETCSERKRKSSRTLSNGSAYAKRNAIQ